jgi:hypothetical protein
MGFHYVLTPVLLNVLVILLVAIVFNFPFPWRRYPAAWARNHKPSAVPASSERRGEIFSREDPATGTGAIEPAPGTNKDDPDTMCSLTSGAAESCTLHPADIRIGAYYCNGEFSPDWQVREVIDSDGSGTTESGMDDVITYRVVAGRKRRHTDTARRQAFAGWARYEVCLNENCWQRIGTTPKPAATGETHEQLV